MGSISTPGTPKPPVPGETASPEAGGPPLTADAQPAGAETSRRIRLPEKKVPLGPRLSTIFGVIAVAAGVVWFLLRPPQNVPVVTLPRYVAFEAPLEQGSPLDCKAAGCLLVILGTDTKTQSAIPSAVEMARALEDKGVETTFVLSGDDAKECARVARLFHRPVLLDPEGEIQKALKFAKLPVWVVHEPDGRIRFRSGESMTEREVLREAGL
jgi:hypothetical protein